jgi:hypothetical protein
VLAINLTTGERELVAGTITDIAGYQHQAGHGEDLNNLRAVRPLQDGTWAALQWHGTELEGSVYVIDPLLQTYSPGKLLGGEQQVGDPCYDLGIYGLGLEPTITPPAFGADPVMWLPYTNADGSEGVLRITQSECEPIDLGVKVVQAITEHDGKVWLIDEARTLWVFDPVTGTKTPKVSGVGRLALAVSGAAAWTVDQQPSLLYTRAAFADSTVSLLDVTGLAALSVQYTPNVWVDDQRLVAALDGAIAVIDIATGQSKIISY